MKTSYKPFLITLAFIIGAFLLLYVSHRMNKAKQPEVDTLGFIDNHSEIK